MRGNGVHNEVSVALSGLLQEVCPDICAMMEDSPTTFRFSTFYIDMRHLAYLLASTNRMPQQHVRLVYIYMYGSRLGSMFPVSAM